MVTATMHELRNVRVRFQPEDSANGKPPWVGLIFRDAQDNRVQLAIFGREQAAAVMVAAARADTLLAEAGVGEPPEPAGVTP